MTYQRVPALTPSPALSARRDGEAIADAIASPKRAADAGWETGRRPASGSEIREAAQAERSVLLEQAMRQHLERMETEMARYRREVAHIEDACRLRTGG